MRLTDLLESTAPEEVASGFRFTEGPLWHPGGYLIFSDIPADTIYLLDPDTRRATPWRHPSGNSNGLAFDRQRRLVACEHGNRRVSRTEADGTITPLATHDGGRRLNSPNDVVVRSDGAIFFTDPPYGCPPEEKELPYNGVYRIDPSGEVTLLLDDFDRPNGLAFSPDEQTLYIDDTIRRHIRAFDVAADGSLSNGRVFAEMASDMEGGPDGMKVDLEGNVYCTGPGALWVFRPNGDLVGQVIGPQRPANLAFGGEDRRTIYLTARTAVYALRARVPGAPL